MEKRQAQDYINEVLNQPFDQEQFELFIRRLLNDIEPRNNSYSGNLIPEAFRDHIAHYRRIGKYTDPEGEQLDILIIQTRSVKKLERTRTALRNFVVRHLKKFEKQYALAAFYSKEDDGADWRFSLVKIEYETRKGKKGKIKVEEELVPAKRFSFLVGKYEDAHTAQKQLLPLLTNDHSNPLIVKESDGDGSIEGAFSIQKVTDEFYEQYKELYLKLAENQSLADALEQEGLDVERFVKKLLGQIVFLYFIQKKGWLGVPKEKKMGQGSKRFLQERFELSEQNGENYYDSFLRYLFYEALAREHNDEGIKYFYKRLNCKIPFLNGGLFEAEFNWAHTDFTIPNELFRNDEKNKAGDKGTGILDVFDRYNFTIKEDEPLEKEVAVDPEMLGKVFENMLEIKERKSKGAYYTPREIVHYMCQESLIHYLDNTVNDYTESYQALGSDQLSLAGGSSDKKGNLNLELKNKGDIRVPKEDLEAFIRKGHLVLENEEIAHEARKRVEKGELKSTTHEQILPDSISNYANQLDDALKNIKICDPAIGSGAFPVGLLHEIVNARLVLNSFLQRMDYTPYNLKRHAIQESIYGVDIDSSAIDIARLRLWLSMIVDEEDYENIEALPNLDYKIVEGNSLIGLPENAMRNLEVEEELEELKKKFFSETDEKEKKKLRTEINSKISDLLDSAEEFTGYEINFDFKLFFSEVWHQKDGFDVVIGNPPYDVYEGKRKDEIPTIKKIDIYDKAKSGKLNAYKLFLAKSSELLKNNGILNLIFQNSFLADNSAKLLRKYFLSEQQIIQIDSFPERDDLDKRVFRSAKMSVCILFSKKKKIKTYNFLLRVWSERWMENNFSSNFSNQEILNYDSTTFLIPSISKNEKAVLDKISKKKRFSSFARCYQGEINLSTNKSIITEIETEETKPLLKGAGIQRWYLPKKMSQGKIEHLYYQKYLEQNKGSKSQHHKFSRIVMQGITGVDEKIRLKSTLIGPGIFCGHSVNYVSFEKISNNVGKYLLALLNSQVSNWFFKKFSTNSNVNSYEVHNLPCPNFNELFMPIVPITDYLLWGFNKLPNLTSTFFDELLNAIIFEIMFVDEIHKAKKHILNHLGNLKAINSEMSDEKKMAIIQSEFERLYDPNHPVRNNLETLDSIEEVRIIKEALK